MEVHKPLEWYNSGLQRENGTPSAKEKRDKKSTQEWDYYMNAPILAQGLIQSNSTTKK